MHVHVFKNSLKCNLSYTQSKVNGIGMKDILKSYSPIRHHVKFDNNGAVVSEKLLELDIGI